MAEARKIAKVTKLGRIAQMARGKARSSQTLAPRMRFRSERGGDMMFGMTGKSSIQAEGSGVNMLRFAVLGDGAGAVGQCSPPAV